MEEKRKANRVLAGKPERERPLGRSRKRKWNKINTKLKTHALRWPIIDSSGSDEGQMAG
jgi:hypothetical protein